MKITWFNHRQLLFLLTLKRKLSRPRSLKASGVLLEDRAKMRTSKRRKFRLTDFERVGGKQEATLTDGIFFIHLISTIYIYTLYLDILSLVISLFWKIPCWKNLQNRNYKTGKHTWCLRHFTSLFLL